jgi:hypothetical protein
MVAKILNNLFGTHVMHNWTEIDCYRYCDCGTLEQCEAAGTRDSEIEWEDVSKDQQAVLEFKLITGKKDIYLN